MSLMTTAESRRMAALDRALAFHQGQNIKTSFLIRTASEFEVFLASGDVPPAD